MVVATATVEAKEVMEADREAMEAEVTKQFSTLSCTNIQRYKSISVSIFHVLTTAASVVISSFVKTCN